MPEFTANLEKPTHQKNVVYISDILQEGPEAFPRFILPGTFDPMHQGHVETKHKAEALLGQPVAIVIVENINKPNKTLSIEERLSIIQEYFPNETIYLALSMEEVTLCHKHAQRFIRKKRSKKDTAEFLQICEQYSLDFTKTVEIEDIPDISSLKFKALAIAGDTQLPTGISTEAYQLLLQKAGHQTI